jgi:hypothetical protein
MTPDNLLILWMLSALFIKHWLADFAYQTSNELKYKGVYGHLTGLNHSIKHGIATTFIFAICSWPLGIALLLGSVDTMLHYHIDWAKSNFGNKDPAQQSFWVHLGLDQLMHAFTYLLLVYMSFQFHDA